MKIKSKEYLIHIVLCRWLHLCQNFIGKSFKQIQIKFYSILKQVLSKKMKKNFSLLEIRSTFLAVMESIIDLCNHYTILRPKILRGFRKRGT